MGLWSSLRKGSSPSNAPAPSGNTSLEAINKIRGTLDILSKKEAYLEQRMAAEQNVALQQAKGNRSAALQALQRRKLLQSQCERIRAARFNLELQLLAIENATLNLETMEAMRQGSQAIKALHGAVSVERVDDTMDEIREQMDVAREIGDAIASPLGANAGALGGIIVDEDELDAELEALQQEALDHQLLAAPTIPTKSPPLRSPPAISTTAVLEEEEEDDDLELQRLKSKMAL